MSYVPPTVADFKSRFDRDFAYSATEDDLSKVRVKDVDLAFVQAAANFNEALFASQATYQEAFLLLSAHFLVVNITASSQGLGGSAQWTTQSKGAGNLAESFAIPPRIARSPFLSQLSKTSYGMNYLQIILPLLCGNVALVKGDTTPVTTAPGVKLHLEEMKLLRAELKKAKGARVKVGVLGDKTGRWGPGSGDWTNAGLGVVHEFGSKKRNIPARSFLRVPLMTRLPSKVDEIGRATWRSLVLTKGVMPALQSLGVVAENLVQRAFETGGFGAWAPLSPRYARWKEQLIRTKSRKLFFVGPVRDDTLLVLSGQLRRAITSRVYYQQTPAAKAP